MQTTHVLLIDLLSTLTKETDGINFNNILYLTQ